MKAATTHRAIFASHAYALDGHFDDMTTIAARDVAVAARPAWRPPRPFRVIDIVQEASYDTPAVPARMSRPERASPLCSIIDAPNSRARHHSTVPVPFLAKRF